MRVRKDKDTVRRTVKAADKQPILRIWRMLNAREREAAESVIGQLAGGETRQQSLA